MSLILTPDRRQFLLDNPQLAHEVARIGQEWGAISALNYLNVLMHPPEPGREVRRGSSRKNSKHSNNWAATAVKAVDADRRVLKALQLHGHQQRTELRQLTGLSKGVLDHALPRLERSGAIYSVVAKSGTRKTYYLRQEAVSA